MEINCDVTGDLQLWFCILWFLHCSWDTEHKICKEPHPPPFFPDFSDNNSTADWYSFHNSQTSNNAHTELSKSIWLNIKENNSIYKLSSFSVVSGYKNFLLYLGLGACQVWGRGERSTRCCNFPWKLATGLKAFFYRPQISTGFSLAGHCNNILRQGTCCCHVNWVYRCLTPPVPLYQKT